MFINNSKIRFESKSQLEGEQDADGRLMFINNSKIRFESKSQHRLSNERNAIGCLSIIQRYVLKANHNLTIEAV